MMNEYIAIAFIAYLLVGLSAVGYAIFKQWGNIFYSFRGIGVFRSITGVMLLCLAFVMCAMFWPIFLRLRITIDF